MESNIDKNEKIQINEMADPVVNTRKINKTLVMLGSVVLISVGCAFVFVSEVYPSLTGNVQLDAVDAEKILGENATEIQATKPSEAEEVPKSASKKKEDIRELSTLAVLLALLAAQTEAGC